MVPFGILLLTFFPRTCLSSYSRPVFNEHLLFNAFSAETEVDTIASETTRAPLEVEVETLKPKTASLIPTTKSGRIEEKIRMLQNIHIKSIHMVVNAPKENVRTGHQSPF
jgi:hypothetical protein